MKKIIILVLLSLISCQKQLDELSRNSSLKRVVSRIESSYNGIIIEKYAPRKTPPTHIKIKTLNNKIIDISPNEEILEFISVGDSIYKYKNENTVKIKKKNGESLITFYVKISYQNRTHEKFPKNWKKKWLESTEK